MADNIRSIPSAIDGLKPGQRKVLFGCFKRKLTKEVKVQSLAGYVLDHTHYQHGDVSLAQTIIALAQTFVGSNNVNLLEPIGNFGSRLAGGKDAASARYISTMLSPFARALFPTLDDAILEYNYEDGDKIEPNWYAPVLPLILINGSDGIGTGWSSSIPNYNPEDIAMNIRRLLDDQELEPMQPWYRGFKGRVDRLTPEKFQFSGIINQVNDTTVEVTELPVRLWTQEFKERLDDIIKPPEKDGKDKDKKVAKVEKAWIKDYLDYNSDLRVHFIIELDSKASMENALKEGLETRFKLNKTASTTNMVAFDAQGRLTRYESPEDILKEFYFVRLKLYQTRKDYVLGELNKQLRKLTNQARFVQMIIKKELVVSNKKRAVLIAELRSQKFDVISNKKEAEESGETEPVAEENEAGTGDDDVGDGYNYLLGMPIWSLTKEKVEKLLAECGAKEDEIDALAKRSPKDLWREDLDTFMEEWHRQLKEDQERATKRSALKKSKKVKTTAGKAAAKKLITGSDGDSDDDFIIKPKKNKAAPKLKQMTLQVTKKAPAPVKPKKEDTDRDIFDISDDDAKNHTPVKKAPMRAANTKTSRIIDLSDDDMEDDDDELKKGKPGSIEDGSDIGSPPKRLSKVSIAGKMDVSTKPGAKKKQLAASEVDSDATTSGKAQAVKKRGRPAGAKNIVSVPKAAKAAKATKQTRKIGLSDEESDEDVMPTRKSAPINADSESDLEPVVRARPGRAAATKASKYTVDMFVSSEESASEAEEEEQSDFDDDDE